MPSELISGGIFYFGARFLFLPVFPPLPPFLSLFRHSRAYRNLSPFPSFPQHSVIPAKAGI